MSINQARNKSEVKRIFSPGDDWLYYKIYAGQKTSDTILKEVISPISQSLINDGVIDKWFFIRYTDPKHHLRVRFHLSATKNTGLIINLLFAPLKEFMDQNLIWKIQLDTYQRELERYGPNTISIVETLFYYESKMILGFLDLIEGEEGEEIRWLFALKSIDTYLNLFKLGDSNKLELLEILKKIFGIEFGMSRPLKKQLDNKYRKLRARIEWFITFDKSNSTGYEALVDFLPDSNETIKSIISQIVEIDKKGNLEVEINDLIASHLHMFINRLFKSKNRLNEMVCYDFLYRYYKSLIARKRFSPT